MNEAFTSASNGKSAVSAAINGVDPAVVIPPDPTFPQLATAIGQISTGKKWASGTTTSGTVVQNYLLADGYITNLFDITVVVLSFTPSIIIATATVPGGVIDTVLFPYSSIGGRIGVYDRRTGQVGSVSTWNIKLEGRAYVNATGFRIPTYSNGKSVQWFAFE